MTRTTLIYCTAASALLIGPVAYAACHSHGGHGGAAHGAHAGDGGRATAAPAHATAPAPARSPAPAAPARPAAPAKATATIARSAPVAVAVAAKPAPAKPAIAPAVAVGGVASIAVNATVIGPPHKLGQPGWQPVGNPGWQSWHPASVPLSAWLAPGNATNQAGPSVSQNVVDDTIDPAHARFAARITCSAIDLSDEGFSIPMCAATGTRSGS